MEDALRQTRDRTARPARWNDLLETEERERSGIRSLRIAYNRVFGPDFRWLTMCTNEQPDFEIILLEPKPGMMMDEETSQQLRALMQKGVLGAGVFNTDDCRGTYEDLKAKGVQFLSEPTERPYGVVVSGVHTA